MSDANSGGFNINKLFSGGLGKGGRAAAWLTAIGVVAAWQYYENRNNGETFSKEEQLSWNEKKKGVSKTDPTDRKGSS
ncbi:hypothetical protein MHU86_723 [Fragilaria crotonensis]|nr:hypothetical protein MHU86_723 [Fragilaria crotonensis]